MIIGVLGVQGSFAEHAQALKGLVDEVRIVRTPSELKGLSGLVIPGGESTTIGDFLTKQGLADSITPDLPVFGTCAGLIVLARRLRGRQKAGQGLLKRIDIEVERNAYGRQAESFEAEVLLCWDDRPFKGVFIRSPMIVKYSSDVKVLARHNDNPVLVEQGNALASAFHPELVDDPRVHRYFIEEVIKNEK